MKRKKLIIRLFLLFVLSAAVFLTACGQAAFFGDREAETDYYRLDIEWMTGTDTHAGAGSGRCS